MSPSALRPVTVLAIALAGCATVRIEDGAHGPRDGASERAPASVEADGLGARACRAAYDALCGPGGEADRTRAARLAAISHEIEGATLASVAPHAGLTAATRDAWIARLASHDPARQQALRRRFRETRAAEVDRRIAPLRVAVEDELARTLARARDAVAASEEPDRGAALARLDAARISWLDLDDPSPLHARALRRGCGESLLVDDAWIDKSATRITLCPGFLLVSLEPADRDLRAFRERIAFLLAHEIGHVIVGPVERTAEDERRAEIGADRWATEILATELARIDPAAREAFLVRTLEPICSLEGDRVHPPGPDRVRHVAEHATVAAALGCRP